MSNFTDVAEMNERFNNHKGNPHDIHWSKIHKQCFNILDEFIELQKALGCDPNTLQSLRNARADLNFAVYYEDQTNLKEVRDGLCDIHVYAYGAHHLLGIDADRDMRSVFDSNMTKFIANEEIKQASIKKYALKDVTDVYFENEFPKMIMKSGSDQKDAPKGKFLKAASFHEPEFYEV